MGDMMVIVKQLTAKRSGGGDALWVTRATDFIGNPTKNDLVLIWKAAHRRLFDLNLDKERFVTGAEEAKKTYEGRKKGKAFGDSKGALASVSTYKNWAAYVTKRTAESGIEAQVVAQFRWTTVLRSPKLQEFYRMMHTALDVPCPAASLVYDQSYMCNRDMESALQATMMRLKPILFCFSEKGLAVVQHGSAAPDPSAKQRIAYTQAKETEKATADAPAKTQEEASSLLALCWIIDPTHAFFANNYRQMRTLCKTKGTGFTLDMPEKKAAFEKEVGKACYLLQATAFGRGAAVVVKNSSMKSLDPGLKKTKDAVSLLRWSIKAHKIAHGGQTASGNPVVGGEVAQYVPQ